jgi:hypothetical protein
MPPRRAINIGQIPHHFTINCNKYYINKSHSVQITPTRGQNANQNPQGGDAIDDQLPHICPTPPLGVNIDRCIIYISRGLTPVWKVGIARGRNPPRTFDAFYIFTIKFSKSPPRTLQTFQSGVDMNF